MAAARRPLTQKEVSSFHTLAKKGVWAMGQNAFKIPCRLPPRRPPSHFSSCFVHRESVCQRPIKNGPRSERRTTEEGRRSVVEGNCRLVTCSNLVRQFVAVITPPTPPSWNTLCSAAPLDDSPPALFVSPPTLLGLRQISSSIRRCALCIAAGKSSIP